MTTHPDPAVRETPGAFPAAPVEPRAAAVVPQAGPADAGRHVEPAPADDWALGVDTVPRASGTPEEPPAVRRAGPPRR